MPEAIRGTAPSYGFMLKDPAFEKPATPITVVTVAFK